MTYGRARYFFYDNVPDPIPDVGVIDIPPNITSRLGIDLEDIQEMWLAWTKESPSKPDSYIIRFRQKTETSKYSIKLGHILFQAWREYCEAKNL